MKRMFIFMLALVLAVFFQGCKSPVGPDGDGGQTEGTIEILYERVLPIIWPEQPNPTAFSVFSDTFGGKTEKWVSGGGDRWQGEVTLHFGYWCAFVCDFKVTPTTSESVARKISARIKGQSEWIELTNIQPHYNTGGEWAFFLLDKNGIHIPN